MLLNTLQCQQSPGRNPGDIQVWVDKGEGWAPAQSFWFRAENWKFVFLTSSQVVLPFAGPGTKMESSWSGVSVKASPREWCVKV